MMMDFHLWRSIIPLLLVSFAEGTFTPKIEHQTELKLNRNTSMNFRVLLQVRFLTAAEPNYRGTDYCCEHREARS